jgi:pyruvate,water dikinase
MAFGSRRREAAGKHGQDARHAYECLRNLLNQNTLLLERMSKIEEDLRFYLPTSPYIQSGISRLVDETLLLTEDLNVLSQGRFASLYRTFDRIRRELTQQFSTLTSDRRLIPLTLSLSRVVKAPRGLAGNKAYNLSRVAEALPEHVPPGFVVTTEAYWRFMHEGGLFAAVMPDLQQLEAIQDPDSLRNRLETIRKRILNTPIPGEIEQEILRRARPESGQAGWAVRSSAEGEDGHFSFAGQFESLLNVPEHEALNAYRQVIQSRFHPRAYLYRRELNLLEIDTPMAVLFLGLVEARSAGVLYTRDPNDRNKGCMLIQSVWGLAQDLVTGRMEGDRFSVARSSAEKTLGERIQPKLRRLVADRKGGLRTEQIADEEAKRSSLSQSDRKLLWEMGHALERHFKTPLDIEWVIDPEGKVWVVQARPLLTQDQKAEVLPQTPVGEKPILEGGITIMEGRASGPLIRVEAATLPKKVPAGSILVVPVATPEIATLLPFLAGFISESGTPTSHAARLLRERRPKIPTLFDVEGALSALEGEETIGLDATHRRIYRGSPWPEPPEKKAERDPRPEASWEKDPLCKRIFPLNLTDPASPRFRADGCSSLHDIIRFVHEKAVETVFDFGDRHAGSRKQKARRLQTDFPLNITVLDLGGAFGDEVQGQGPVAPSQIASIPFQATWQGMADPEMSWAGRQQVSLKGFTSVLVSSMATSGSGARKLGDQNYLLVARDYMNMNLRLAYHYTMVDALVGESAENNFVNFRFRGGGAGADRRELRAKFLSEILRRSRFAVDRRGDLVTAWFRRYPRARCEEALAMLGRLMACSRQLDMLIANTRIAHDYAERFLAGDYEMFR